MTTRSALLVGYPLLVGLCFHMLRVNGAQTLTGPGTQASDFFGTVIALSSNGSLLIVGASGYSGGNSNGAVFSYACSAGSCATPGHRFQGPGNANYDNFGCSVALSSSGYVLVVGASGVSTVLSSAGAAYTYTCSDGRGTCAYHSTLTPSNAAANDYFGTAVAISGDGSVVAIGATGRSSGVGVVYTYTCSGPACTNQRSVSAIGGGQAHDAFGGAVALCGSGAMLVVGAIGRSSFKGTAFAYACVAGACSDSYTIFDPSGITNSYFGTSVDVSADCSTVAVGSPGGASVVGSVSVYTAGSWTHSRITSTGPSGDTYGGAVALTSTGLVLLVGADGPSATALGLAYSYTCALALCTSLTTLSNTGGVVGDLFGISIASNNDSSVVAIAGTGVSSQMGAVYVFLRTPPTPSQSLSSSLSQTLTTSQAQSQSQTQTATVTISQTQGITRSQSQSPSVAQSPSQTWSASQTLSTSLTASNSGTHSGSQAVTQSGTETASSLQTHSQTQSSSRSQLPTTSQTASQTQTVSLTQTPSMTISASETQSPSETLTCTASGSRSQAVSATSTQTASFSATHSLSATRMQIVTLTQTQSQSRATSAFMSPSLSESQGSTPFPSQAPSLPKTQSPSVSTLGITQSSSEVAVTSASVTPTLTSSRSQTATQTRTPSTSREPYALLFSYTSSPLLHSSAHVGSDVLAISDSLAAKPVVLRLSRCPSDDSGGVLSVSLSCSVSPAGPLASHNSSMQSTSLFQELMSFAPVSAGPVTCDPSSDDSVALSVSDTVGAYFGTRSGVGTLRCLVSSSASTDGHLIAVGTQPVIVSATLWPLWVDAILVTDFGIMRSARLGVSVNATQELLLLSGCGNVAEATRNLSAVLNAAHAMWESISLSTEAELTFSMTLTGSTTVVLRALQAAFRAGTSATLGSGKCVVGDVSENGMWLALVTPPTSATCLSTASTSSDCGYVTLIVNTTTGPIASSTSSFVASLIDVNGIKGEEGAGYVADPLGAALLCPPFCPGAFSDVGLGGNSVLEVVPFPLPDGTFSLATNPSAVGVATPPHNLTSEASALLSSSTSAGVYYALACSETGVFADPTSGVCSNASNPASTNCAYGSGEKCQRCPLSALCPGGFRLWPRSGFWAAYDTTGVVTPCAAPKPEMRCTGWSVALGETRCGTGYLQGSYLCSACAPGNFLEDDGTCNACPVIKSVWDRYRTVLYLVIVLVVVVAAVWAGLQLLMRLRGGTLLGGAARMLDLFVWGLLSAQVVSNAATVASPTLAPLLASLFRAAAVLQLQGVLLPPACTGAYAFESEASLMGLALCAWATCVAAYYSRRYLGSSGSLRQGTCIRLDQAVALCGRAALTVALVLYSSCATTAVSMLNCSSLSVAASSVAALDGGASVSGSASASPAAAAAAVRGATVAVEVLSKNPYFVCWAGSHRAVGMLSAATLALYVAVLPAALLAWAWTDPWLHAQLRLHRSATTEQDGTPCSSSPPPPPPPPPAGCLACCGGRKPQHDTVITLFTQNPMRGEVVLALQQPHVLVPIRLQPAVQGHAAAPTASTGPHPNPMLLPLLGDYVPSAWYTKLVDILLLLALALLRALVPRPTAVGLIATKAAVSCTLLLAACGHVLLVRPYLPQQAWKSWVRALLLFDSAGCALLNAALSALDAGLDGPRLRASIPVGSYILLVLCCITLAVLLWRFATSMYAGAEAEQQHLVLAEAAAEVEACWALSGPARFVVPLPQDDAEAAAQEQKSPPLSTSGQVEDEMRFVSNPIQQRRGRSVRSSSRRRVARHSAALCAASGDPEAARIACVALRDALRDALAVAQGPAGVNSEDVVSAVGALSGALVRYAAHAAVVQEACEGLLAATEFNSRSTHTLFVAAAPQGLVAALRNHGASSDAITRAACGALAVVAASATGATALADAGGVVSLLGVLQASKLRRSGLHPSEEETEGAGIDAAAAQACHALAQLCQHEDAVPQLTGSDVVRALVDVLGAAASALSRLVAPAESTLISMAAASDAAQALAAITVHDVTLPHFIAAGGAPALVALLQVGLRMPRRISATPTMSSAATAAEYAAAGTTAVSPVAAGLACLSKEQLNMATHVAEAMLSLSTTASGTIVLFEAGAIPPLLQACDAAGMDAEDADCGANVNATARIWSNTQLALWEAACWALRGFTRDREQLRALTAGGAVTALTALIAACTVHADTHRQALAATLAAAVAQASVIQRVAENARALLGTLQASTL